MNHPTDAVTEERPALRSAPSVSYDFHAVLSESRRALSEANAALAALQQQAMQTLVATPQSQQNLANTSLPAPPKTSKKLPKITASRADALLQMRIMLERQQDRQEQQHESHEAHGASPHSLITQPVVSHTKGLQSAPLTPPSKQR
jgi:Sec-independent protein translocase protein TatA